MITKPFTIKHLMPPADILCLWAKPSWRSILREEEFGVVTTLKRLDHKNPSVGIDGMNDYQANFNKRWQNQSFLSVNVFTFVTADPNSIHGLLQQRQIMMKCWVSDRLRPCKHISLEFPSPIFIVGLSTRVGKQPTCFSGCEFFFAIRLYNCNGSHLDMSDLHSWFSG